MPWPPLSSSSLQENLVLPSSKSKSFFYYFLFFMLSQNIANDIDPFRLPMTGIHFHFIFTFSSYFHSEHHFSESQFQYVHAFHLCQSNTCCHQSMSNMNLMPWARRWIHITINHLILLPKSQPNDIICVWGLSNLVLPSLVTLSQILCSLKLHSLKHVNRCQVDKRQGVIQVLLDCEVNNMEYFQSEQHNYIYQGNVSSGSVSTNGLNFFMDQNFNPMM